MARDVGPMNGRAAKSALPQVVAAVIERDGKVLIARRRREIGYGGLWEFPGGKLESGESPETGLRRELAEEFGVRARIGRLLCRIPFRGRSLSIELLAYHVIRVSGRFQPVDHDDIRWVRPSDLKASMFTAPDRPVVRALRARAAGRAKPAGEGENWKA